MTKMTIAIIKWAIGAAALFVAAVGPVAAAPAHGIAMHGAPALGPTDPLPYTVADAPKGGTITFGMLGTFDSLNPAIPRGAKAPGLRDPLHGNLIYESLMERNHAEPFSLYGLIAQSIETDDDRTYVTFRLNPAARLSDGEPITSADVAFTHALLREQGWPYARTYYSKVESVETPDEATITFRFPNANDRELPLILGLMPIFPEHDTDPETFGRTTLDPPVGSGPYTIAEVVPGRSVTYQRNDDYWANDHPLTSGRYNADTVRFITFRDENTLFEAFKAGQTDIFLEGDAARWTSGYDIPPVRDGRIIQSTVPTGTPRGMFAFVMNTRRPPFDQKPVREAMNLLFDFEWINAQLFSGVRSRTDSFFSASDLASTGHPASDMEREMLAAFPSVVPPAIMDGTWAPPKSDGSGRDRNNLRQAVAVLREAGYRLEDGNMVGPDGEPLTFEILVQTRDDERLALAYSRLLRPIGVDAPVRFVDSQQYQARMLEFDFQMARVYWPASLSPGNEQIHRWSAAAADQQGSFNYAGATEPAIDAMIGEMLAARDRDRFEAAVRALDRVLLSGTYVVPLFHTPEQWVSYAAKIGRPDMQSLSGVEFETWWVNE